MATIPEIVRHYQQTALPFKALDERLIVQIENDRKTSIARLLEIEYSAPRHRNNGIVLQANWLKPDVGHIVVPLQTAGSLFHYYNKIRSTLNIILEQLAIFPEDDNVLYVLRAPEDYRLSRTKLHAGNNWWHTP